MKLILDIFPRFQGNPAIITVLDGKNHFLQNGSTIMLKEVNGMTEVNGKCFKVKNKSPFEVSINCDSTTYNEYKHGGIGLEVKQSEFHDFRSLEAQLQSPEIIITDYGKKDSYYLHFLLMVSVFKFLEIHSRKPDADKDEDYNSFLNIAQNFNEHLSAKKLSNLFDKIKRETLRCLQHQFAPLCASLGGIAAQEVLKAVTGKFSPIKEWFLYDATELLGGTIPSAASRYLPLNCCIGEELSTKLANTKLFMVGCGAIGCEMLKNFALLGIGSGENGKITITDNDLIEKSNLNRQFLFRHHHIQV